MTDHSPCPPDMKRLEEGNFQNRVGWNFESFSSAAVGVDRGQRRGFTLTDIARWMAEGPARLAGLEGAKRPTCGWI